MRHYNPPHMNAACAGHHAPPSDLPALMTHSLLREITSRSIMFSASHDVQVGMTTGALPAEVAVTPRIWRMRSVTS